MTEFQRLWHDERWWVSESKWNRMQAAFVAFAAQTERQAAELGKAKAEVERLRAALAAAGVTPGIIDAIVSGDSRGTKGEEA